MKKLRLPKVLYALRTVLYTLRTPDAELSLLDFERRYAGIPDGQTGLALGRLAELAFREGKPFHNEGFIWGVDSGEFKPEELDSAGGFSQPQNYFTRGNRWVRPEYAFRFIDPSNADLSGGSLFANSKANAEEFLKNSGITPTSIKPVDWMDWVDTLGKTGMKRRITTLVQLGTALGVLAVSGHYAVQNNYPQGKRVNASRQIASQGQAMPQLDNMKTSGVAQNSYARTPRTNTDVQLSASIVPVPANRTNKLENVVDNVPVPKRQETNVVEKVQYDLTPLGRIVVNREPMLVYPNSLAQANEFPFVLSREYDGENLFVPTLLDKEGKFQNELDLSSSGIKASRRSTVFPAKGARLLTQNGLWCELRTKQFGTNQVYVFPRVNGSFYAIDSSGAHIKSDSNRNVTLTSANGIYSTKHLTKRKYLERKRN